MKKKNLAKAILPFMLFGSPALASNVKLASSSRKKTKAISIESNKSENKELNDPFAVFDNSQILKDPQTTQDSQDELLGFLKENELLKPLEEKSNNLSGDLDDRKNFAGLCNSRYVCDNNTAINCFPANTDVEACPGGSSDKTVTFNANGGTGSMSSQKASSATNLTSNGFTRSGYTFSGWNTAANGSGTAYTNGQSYNFSADITLYAQWSDATAPTLSSISSANVAETTVEVKATSNEAGTMYYVISTSSSSPTYAQVSGNTVTNGVKSGNSVVSASSAKTFSVTGLTAGTQYYYYIVAKDAANNESSVSNGTFTTLVADTAPPVVQSIATTGSPAKNATSVVFRVTFNESVNSASTDDFSLTTTGSASGNISSISASSGTTIDVTVNNISGEGNIRVDLKANTNITDSAGNGNNTNGYVSAYTSGATHTVDLSAPNVTSVSVPANATYKTGGSLSFTVNTNENVTVTGTPRLSLNIGGTTKYATYVSGSGTQALVYTYSVESGLSDNDGITVAGTIDLNSGTLKDSAGNDIVTTLNSIASTSNIKIDSISPTITISSAQNSLKSGETATITFTLSEASSNFVQSDISVVGGTLSNFSGSGTSYTATFTPSINSTTTATINVSSTKFTDAAGNNNTAASQKTISIDTLTPSITSVGVPDNKTYKTGENLDFTVNTNENVTVTGIPSIALTIGSTGKTASYTSGSGTQALVFRYTVESDLSDSDGIAVGALSLNSGTLKDSAGNNMTTTLNSVGDTSNVKVDSIAPSVTSVSVPNNKTYITGESLDFTVNTSENVTVNTGGGTPSIALTIGSTGKTAIYTSGSGTQALVFRYTVENNLNDNDGITVGALSLNSGTLKDGAGNDMLTTLNSIASTTSVLVDTVAPSLSSSSPADGASDVSTTANLVLTFNENIKKGTGNIVIKYDTNDTVAQTIAVTDSAVSISGTSLTINPSTNLNLNTAYHVQIAADAIDDIAGNSYAGIADKTTWNFTTVNNQSPTISGAKNHAVNDNVTSPITPFSSVTLADNESDNVSVSLSLDDNNKGTLSSTSISSTTVANAQTALRAITFTPTANRVKPGTSETTTITITVNDGNSDGTNNSTTIVSTSINDVSTDISIDKSSIKYKAGNGATVGTLSTSDVDNGESYTYQIVGKDASSNGGTCTSDTNNTLFGISGNDLTVADPSTMEGNYSICINSNDGSADFKKTLSINVIGNTAPKFGNITVSDSNISVGKKDNLINKIVVYKNYSNFNISIMATDDDSDPITYSSTYSKEDLFSTKTWSSNVLTLGSDANISGISDINFTIKDDRNASNVKTINFVILDLADDGGTNVTYPDEDSYEVTKNTGSTTLKIKENTNNGSTEHTVSVSGTETKASSSLDGTIVKTEGNTVKTTYTDSGNGVDIEVLGLADGKATHSLKKDGETVEATSKIAGAQTTINTDSSGQVQIVTKVSNVEVQAKADGSASHKVSNGSLTSSTTAKIAGAKTVIENDGSVETSAGKLTSSDGKTIKAKVITDSTGKSVTKFILVDGSGNESDMANTLSGNSSFENGNEVEIYEDLNEIYIKTTATLNDNLIVE